MMKRFDFFAFQKTKSSANAELFVECGGGI